MKTKKTSYIYIFWQFFKLGFLMTGGGSISMLPLIKSEFVERLKWISDDDLMDYYTISQCTPGIITINIATFLGFKKRGIMGAIIATLGIFMSAFIPIILIAALVIKLESIHIVRNAILGVSVGACVLMAFVAQSFWKSSIVDVFSTIIFVLSLLGTLFFNLSPVPLIILSAIGGIIYQKRIAEGENVL